MRTLISILVLSTSLYTFAQNLTLGEFFTLKRTTDLGEVIETMNKHSFTFIRERKSKSNSIVEYTFASGYSSRQSGEFAYSWVYLCPNRYIYYITKSKYEISSFADNLKSFRVETVSYEKGYAHRYEYGKIGIHIYISDIIGEFILYIGEKGDRPEFY